MHDFYAWWPVCFALLNHRFFEKTLILVVPQPLIGTLDSSSFRALCPALYTSHVVGVLYLARSIRRPVVGALYLALFNRRP